MVFKLVIACAVFLKTLFVLGLQAEFDLLESELGEKVAIIGAGAGGSSAAYYLQRFTNHSYDITLFDSNDYIGGRCATDGILFKNERNIELGASIFVKENRILMNAIKDFSLGLEKYEGPKVDNSGNSEDSVGIWDGSSMFLTFDGSIWSKMKFIYRYGVSLFRFRSLLKVEMDNFLSNFYETHFPFNSIEEIVHSSGIISKLNKSGLSVMRDLKVSDKFAEEIVQAATRGNFVQNIDKIHGFAAFISMAADYGYSVSGGNWQIFQSFIKYSKATTFLGTSVLSINKSQNRDGYYLTVWNKATETLADYYYDKVIIAAPYQSTNISGIDIQEPISRYVKLHVTLVSSKVKISPQFFGENIEVPETILSTVPLSSDIRLPIFTSSLQDYDEIKKIYTYKFFSSEDLNDELLAAMFTDFKEISNIYKKTWDSFPYLVPRSKFAEFQVSKNLWYLNSFELVISTMETSALMGANVAALISKGKNTTEMSIP